MGSSYKIVNNLGKTILFGKLNEAKQINLTSFPAGVYNLIIYNNRKNYNQKILIE